MDRSRAHRATRLAAAAVPSLVVAQLAGAQVARSDARAPNGLLPGRASNADVAARATVRFGEVRIATGVRLHYAERGDVSGPAVILLHGYSDSWGSFGRILPLLPARLHVYALDQRGHGDSDRPRSGYAMRDLAADVVAFMAAKGIDRATVVGHSTGGFVAQQVALAAPGRVAGLVLVGTATAPARFVGITELEAAIAAFPESEAPAALAFVREFQESTVHRPVPAAFMDSAVTASRKLPARVWRALLDGLLATQVAAGLGAHRIPTLVLWGDRDAYSPRAEQDALLRLIPGARLVVYAETGHAPHWERPAEFARDVAAFVDAGRVPPAQAGGRD